VIEPVLALSALPLSHHPEIVLRVLVAILRLDDIAVQSRFTGERQVPFIIPFSIPGAVLALPRASIRADARRPPSLRSLISVPHLIH